MRMNKKAATDSSRHMWQSILFGILGIVVFVGVIFAAKWLLAKFGGIGNVMEHTPMNLPYPVEMVFTTFGLELESLQSFVISLGFLFIFCIAMSDILVAFSTFSRPAAYSIGIALGLISSAAGAVKQLYQVMLTGVAFTGVALFILILFIVAEAIVINVFFGSLLGRVRLARKIEEDAANTKLGAEIAKNAISGLGTIGKGLTSAAKENK